MRDNTLRAAPFFTRAAAYVLDRLLLAAVLFVPRLTLSLHGAGGDPLARAVFFTFSWQDILLWALGAAYFVVLTALGGATLGKKALGITVVDKNGEKPGFVTVLCRETFGRYLSSLMCIGYILFLVDPEHGTLHDRICDTMVVYAPPKTERPAPAKAKRVDVPALPAGSGDDWYAPNR